MTKYPIALLLAVLMINIKISAEIKNGYGNNIIKARMLLEDLRKVKNNNHTDKPKSLGTPSLFQQRIVKQKIDSLTQCILNYERTEEYLDRFRNIAPELYNQIDTMKNKYGIGINVYVKFYPDEQMCKTRLGESEVGQYFQDENICFSDYGINTVSVMIYATMKPLNVLAHEFGHIKYIVPNLKSYKMYFKKTYVDRSFEGYFIGHYPDDNSGKMAQKYEREYRKCYKNFNMSNKDLEIITKK